MARPAHTTGWRSISPILVPYYLANQWVRNDLVEAIDFYPLVLDSLMHPISALNSNFNAISVFRGQTFDPGTDIPRLTNKVIFVTGGKNGFRLPIHCTNNL